MTALLLRWLTVSWLAGFAFFEFATSLMAAIWVPHAGGADAQWLWLSRGFGYAFAADGLVQRQPAAYPLAMVLFAAVAKIHNTPVALLNDYDVGRLYVAWVGLVLVVLLALADAVAWWQQRGRTQ
ncbi:MAG: hypothetical protein RLZZ383_2497 [Pseudomonadota bacterium]|jgi:hypothetical protein